LLDDAPEVISWREIRVAIREKESNFSRTPARREKQHESISSAQSSQLTASMTRSNLSK
jgi:hypothetical protein